MILGLKDPLEKGMATHSSTLAWRIPWTEEPGRPQSTGSQRVRHDLATKQLYSVGNSSQCCVVTYLGKESEKSQTHVCVQLNHSDIYLKLTQHC